MFYQLAALARLELFIVLLPSGVIAFVFKTFKVTFAYSTLQTPQVHPGLEVLKPWVSKRLITRESIALLDHKRLLINAFILHLFIRQEN